MRRGQVILYLLMVLVAITLLSLLNVDTFLVVRGKNRVQNAGDAAALRAAREQGRILNEIGRLNLEHILAAVENDSNECERIVLEQRRAALLQPVAALEFANEAAEKNGMEVREEFSKILEDHVREIREVYCGGSEDEYDPYCPPWPGAWEEYAAKIEEAISGGLRTGPDNVEFFYASGGHLLLNRQFYHAIAGYNWCWFHWNAEEWLKSYDSYHDWPDLPIGKEQNLDNSEIFNLHVEAWEGALTDILDTNQIAKIYREYADNGELSAEKMALSHILTNRNETWFLFDSAGVGTWGRWFNVLSLVEDVNSGEEFPIVGEIKEEYNVRGCAAICRCVMDVEAFAIDSSSAVTWSAAAKPFGTVVNFDGEKDVVTALRRFIVPCFDSVRLVAVDSVGGENLATADYGWVTHIRKHLWNVEGTGYLQKGPLARSSEGCFYCLMLENWEHRSFRREGISWLKYNAATCVRPTGGGPASGGTSHGH